MKHIARFFIAYCLCFIPQNLYAGELTIDGVPKISTTFNGETATIQGSYEITNRGNEIAQNVFPQLELGQWKWAGEPKTLSPGTNATWELKQDFPVQRLMCSEGADCHGAGLPVSGVLPARVLRLYEDVNGHGFSAADVLRVPFGNLTDEQSALLRVPKIVEAMKCSGDGEEFECQVQIRNVSNQPFKATSTYHTSREVEVKSPAQQVEVGANASKTLQIHLRNFSGLTGSSYQVFSILEWEEAGLRNAAVVSANINIEEPSHSNFYLIVTALAVVVLGGLLYWFVFRGGK